MARRVGRPGLLGTMARTAVISGTAQAVGGNMARRQNRKWAAKDQQAQAAEYEAQQQVYQAQQQQAQLEAMQAQMAAMQAAPAAPQVAAAPAGGGGDLMGELQKLAQMKESGILSDAEFAAAKAKLLG